MKTFTLAAAAALLAGSASAATFTYEIDTSTLEQTPGFSEIAFGAGTSYGPSDYTISGVFDINGDFVNGFASLGTSVTVTTASGETLSYSGLGRANYNTQFERLDIATSASASSKTFSLISFTGIRPNAISADAITAEILTGAEESFFGIFPSEDTGSIDLVSLLGPDAVSVTSGSLEGVAPVPLPAAAPLLAMGLGAVGWAARRRKA